MYTGTFFSSHSIAFGILSVSQYYYLFAKLSIPLLLFQILHTILNVRIFK